MLVISNQPRVSRSSNYALNCTPLSPFTITNNNKMFHKMSITLTSVYKHAHADINVNSKKKMLEMLTCV